MFELPRQATLRQVRDAVSPQVSEVVLERYASNDVDDCEFACLDAHNL